MEPTRDRAGQFGSSLNFLWLAPYRPGPSLRMQHRIPMDNESGQGELLLIRAIFCFVKYSVSGIATPAWDAERMK
jgi:hypothetical protein